MKCLSLLVGVVTIKSKLAIGFAQTETRANIILIMTYTWEDFEAYSGWGAAFNASS